MPFVHLVGDFDNEAGRKDERLDKAGRSLVPMIVASPEFVTAIDVVTEASRPSAPSSATAAWSSTPELVRLTMARIREGRPMAKWANQYP